ncbi:MAG: hypothetical protein R3Y58_13420 [Eubacteriales bacterium]
MVILKNIKKINNIISCDYYPEGQNDKGEMQVDMDKKIVIQTVKSKLDENVTMYSRHVKRKLIELSEYEILPEEYRCVWY